jgi:hypothetical protein
LFFSFGFSFFPKINIRNRELKAYLPINRI